MDFVAQRRIMVDSQIRVNDVTAPAIVTAFLNVPREAFVPSSQISTAYAEYELDAGEGRALWTPRDLGKILRGLDPQSADIALVVGAGAGYSAAILSEIVDTAIALEESEASVDIMTERFGNLGLDSAVAVPGDLATGLPDQGPFDVILVGGMVETVPQAWLDQLNEGGRLGVVVAHGKSLGKARIYTRAGDTVSYRDMFECCPPTLAGFEKAAEFEF